MGTRNSIGIVNKDGTVETVYCQFDGYPSHNGKILQEHYCTESRVRELLEQGDMSQLGEHIAPPEGVEHSLRCSAPHTCVFYKRDDGRTGQESKKHTNIAAARAVVDGEWLYLFRLDVAGCPYWSCWHPIRIDSSENSLVKVLGGRVEQ
jgi:hypothetical protein